MYQTYSNIFSRLGLDFRAVLADTGNIGGSTSHEFHVLADSGEDDIVFNSTGSYSANIELADGFIRDLDDGSADMLQSREIDTALAHTIEALTSLLELPATRLIKTLIVKAVQSDTNPHKS